MKKKIEIILLVICIIIFIFSSYKIIKYFVEAHANKEINEQLLEKAISPSTSDEEEKEQGKNLPFTVDFTVLKQENKDIVGWIYSKDSPINYPVLQSDNNEYYLRRLINGKYNTSGSIFIDYRNNANFTDNNTILYGHNMRIDTMFGTLQKYRNQEYYEKHKIMYLFTPEKNYIVKLFAGFTENANSSIYNLTGLNQTEINELIEKSDFNTELTVTEENRIITLSTCAYEYDEARYIVMGILENIE